jgi:hypothetical protein
MTTQLRVAAAMILALTTDAVQGQTEAAASAPGAFRCTAVDRVLAAAPVLESLRGNATGDASWAPQPDLDLGAVRDCTLDYVAASAGYPAGRATLACSAEPRATLEAAVSDLQALGRDLARCLPRWHSGTTTVASRPSFIFRLPSATLVFVIAVSDVKPAGGTTPSLQGQFRVRLGVTTVHPNIVAVAFANPPWRATGDAFCADLKRVVAGRSNNFLALRGRQRNAGEFVARSDIAGTEECEIDSQEGSKDQTFSCTPARALTRDQLRGAYEALVSDVRSCLGDPWQKRTRSRSDDRRVTTFAHPQQPGSVAVREVVGSSSMRLSLDIDSTD